jgi:imidazolonepropionase-like amidohydrolase
MRRLALFSVAVLSLWAARPGSAQAPSAKKPAPVLAFRAAMVHPVSGKAIPNGVVLVQGGTILAVGPTVPIPPGAELLDAGRGSIVPGFVESWGTAGLLPSDVRRGASEGQSVLDAWNPYDETPSRLLGGGVTIRPGPRPGAPEVLAEDGAPRLVAGSPAASGNPMVWAKAGDALRAKLEGAKKYKEARAKYLKELAAFEKYRDAWKAKQKGTKPSGTKPAPRPAPRPTPRPTPRPPMRLPPGMRPPTSRGGPSKSTTPKRPRLVAKDAAQERWVAVLERKLPVRVVAYRARAIASICEVAKELRVRLVIEGGAEADRPVALKALVETKAAVLVHMAGGAGVPAEHTAVRAPGYFARLAKAKVPVALTLGRSDARSSRDVRFAAAMAAAEGCPPEVALAGVTAMPAAACGLPRGFGTLVKGAPADLVVLSGPPTDVRSRILAVIAGGKRVR